MSKRAAAAAQTRRKIVDATRELHAERGIAATSWDDIAARAGVGVGTVYRHFPSLDELVPACGQVSLELAALPEPAAAPALFDGLETPAERIGRLVELAFAIYGRASRELQVTRREPGAHPSVAEAGQVLEDSLSALVDTALEPSACRRRSARSPARWSISTPGRRCAAPASASPPRGERDALRPVSPRGLRLTPLRGSGCTVDRAPARQ